MYIPLLSKRVHNTIIFGVMTNQMTSSESQDHDNYSCLNHKCSLQFKQALKTLAGVF